MKVIMPDFASASDLSPKEARRFLKQALGLVEQGTPFKLIRVKPDPGFSIAYSFFDSKGFLVGTIEREEDQRKCWWIRKGDSDCQEGIGFILRHLEKISKTS